MDTIYALATARGKAGIAIVRVSGPDAWAATAQLCGTLPEPRRAALRILKDRNGQPLDESLVLLFEEKQSFTGEQVSELNLHGSTAVVGAVLRELSEFKQLRLAEPGEFTRRALENNRLDLAQVEGLADLIDAETEAQRRQALRVLSGDIGRRAKSWRTRLIRAAALIEATIDFADEEVPVDVTPDVLELVQGVLADLRLEVAGAQVTERIRDGFEVAIVGRPNAGKSTLLNALAGREAAITSEFAGTTRDVIEVRMDLGGIPVTLLDTAGLRETDDKIEEIGISRALARAQSADLRLFLLDESGDTDLIAPKSGDIVVYGKADLFCGEGRRISAVTGEGLDELLQELEAKLLTRTVGSATLTRERHRLAAVRAIAALESVEHRLSVAVDDAEISAEEIRSASRALSSLVGAVDVEHLLDEIFTSFCIGK